MSLPSVSNGHEKDGRMEQNTASMAQAQAKPRMPFASLGWHWGHPFKV